MSKLIMQLLYVVNNTIGFVVLRLCISYLTLLDKTLQLNASSDKIVELFFLLVKKIT